MNMPKAVKSIVIKAVEPGEGLIALEAEEEMAEVIRQFGVLRWDEDRQCRVLRVSERFNFHEVADWLQEQAG